MCQTSTIDSEYYRKQWDPTFHPLLYHMLQDLSYQANNFQKSVDPIYHTFLKQCLSPRKTDNSKTIRRRSSKNTPKKANVSLQRYKKKKWNRDFAALSILTCGNSFLGGYTNMRHRDNDYITYHGCRAMIIVLQKMLVHYRKYNETNLLRILNHLRNRFMKNKRFSTYTTCGYKFFQSTDHSNKGMKRHHVYFIYNSLGIAIHC